MCHSHHPPLNLSTPLTTHLVKSPCAQTNVYKRYGIETSVVDSTDLEAVKKALKEGKTKVVYIETPGNPLCSISDIAECARLAHTVGAICVVDSTFASPIFQNPIVLGADIALHSITKVPFPFSLSSHSLLFHFPQSLNMSKY